MIVELSYYLIKSIWFWVIFVANIAIFCYFHFIVKNLDSYYGKSISKLKFKTLSAIYTISSILCLISAFVIGIWFKTDTFVGTVKQLNLENKNVSIYYESN